jgi:hypothetical protein
LIQYCLILDCQYRLSSVYFDVSVASSAIILCFFLSKHFYLSSLLIETLIYWLASSGFSSNVKLSKILLRSRHWLFKQVFSLVQVRTYHYYPHSTFTPSSTSRIITTGYWHCIYYCLHQSLALYLLSVFLSLPAPVCLHTTITSTCTPSTSRIITTGTASTTVFINHWHCIFCQSVLVRVSTVCTPPPRRLLCITESSIFVLLF